MTQYDERLQNAINAETLDDNAKSGMWSAYVDGKLYRNQKGKSTWNQKGHLTNSIRNQSSIARNLRFKLEWEYQQKYPEHFEKSPFNPDRLWVKSGYRQIFESIINLQFDQWFQKHVKYVSGCQEFKENTLNVVAEYIKKAEGCMNQAEEEMEDKNNTNESVQAYGYWEGAYYTALAIEKEIKALYD